MAQCKDGIGHFTPHSSPSAAVVCVAARRVHSIAFALTVSAPASSPILFSSASHFLKKALRVRSAHVRIDNRLMTICKNVLGFVTCHFLSEYTIEEVSEVMMSRSTQMGTKKRCLSSPTSCFECHSVQLPYLYKWTRGPIAWDANRRCPQKVSCLAQVRPICTPAVRTWRWS
jgi:hypothetical protein